MYKSKSFNKENAINLINKAVVNSVNGICMLQCLRQTNRKATGILQIVMARRVQYICNY